MMASHDDRRVELAKIHIAKAQLGLDDETYRAMLWTIGRVRSAADLGIEGRRAVLEHLVARGFKAVKKSGRPTDIHGAKPAVPAARQAQVSKIEALLADAERPWAYAGAMARRICKVDRIEWCTAEQLGKIIAALSYDAKRRAAKGAA